MYQKILPNLHFLRESPSCACEALRQKGSPASQTGVMSRSSWLEQAGSNLHQANICLNGPILQKSAEAAEKLKTYGGNKR